MEYLVTSRTRRHLLQLLWGEKERGSVTELAARAGVAFASAHGELKALEAGQLVVATREGKDVYQANLAHPHAATLEALVAANRAPGPAPHDELLKRKLVFLGAPLRGVTAHPVPPSDRMRTLRDGALLARRDAVVARTVPLCFWGARDELDTRALAEGTPRPEDKHVLGFFLALTGELGGDRRLVGLAETFRDRRMTRVRPFFQPTRHRVAREFPLAAAWGFAMNLDLEAFRSLFEKFEPRV